MTADTLASLLLDRAQDDRPGLMFEDTTWSWREHVAACRATGAWLPAQGAGAHVGVLCDNVPELVFLVGAAALGGPVVVALNPTRAVGELVRDARATDVSLLLAGDPYGPAARTVAEALGIAAVPLSAVSSDPAGAGRGPDGAPRGVGGRTSPAASAGAPRAPETAHDPGGLVMLVFTSGTSGRPRAVRITQRKLAVPGRSLAALLTPGDVVYCSMPLFHSGALMAAYAPAVASGAALVLRRRFSASGLLPDIRRYGGTYLHYVGKALSYVLATPERPDDAANPLKVAFGNEGSAVAVRRFGERFGCRVIDAFGSTETAISFTPDPGAPPGCLGRLPEGVAILDPSTGRACPPGLIEDGRLLNPDEAVGELVNTAGLGLFEGYYNDPDADAERVREGAYWSGDLAYTDADGYVFFAGRGTERLRVDGENLAVAPVEAALREFDGVVEAAVYPVPDPAAGDQVMAALVMETAFDPAAFAAFLASRRDLGAKSLPRYIRLSEHLPQTPSHKVIKRILAAEAWRAADPVWLRTPGGFRLLTDADVKGIEEEFVRHGRHHLLER
ncbi:acyl-CoA synthetase [Nonomuraea sp. KC401]|uniref:AMP-binding protein n=1 Tax=unclassified Nonomuraea TaxID=2593643 RepID=UPI0010FD9DE3|nr:MULTISPECIES: AMP-binding protein [unclassified Nonomuraea]NBE96527.1 AMP-binding protein [Nonomuraea sp. K271]TLF68608.1 acyl-CoA synthetase [Nonomuraea sp. KC401]